MGITCNGNVFTDAIDYGFKGDVVRVNAEVTEVAGVCIRSPEITRLQDCSRHNNHPNSKIIYRYFTGGWE